MNRIHSGLYYRNRPLGRHRMRTIAGFRTAAAKTFSVMISILFGLLPGAGLAWAQGAAEYGIMISGAGTSASATQAATKRAAKKLRRRPANNRTNNKKTRKSFHLPALPALSALSDGENLNVESSADFPAKEDQPVTRPGKLLVRSTPTGALVWIDGKPAGKTPLLVALDAGKYQIELRGSRMATAKQEIVLKPNESRKLLLQLKPRYPMQVKLGGQVKLGRQVKPGDK